MKPMKKIFVAGFVLLFGTVGSLASTADINAIMAINDPEEKGRAIAKAAEDRGRGFGDSVSTMRMVLTNAKGQESVRQLRLKTLEDPDEPGESKSLVVFDQPRDVAGTALLAHAHKGREDEQWLYLPALARVKRISGSNRSGSFMGSEFSFEDFSTPDLDEFTYEHLRDEPCGHKTCWVMEQMSKDTKTSYRRRVAWIDQTDLLPHRIDFYDRRNELQKTLTFSDYKLYQDKFWRAHLFHMKNHLTGKQTHLHWDEIKFGVGLNERDFTRNALKRAR